MTEPFDPNNAPYEQEPMEVEDDAPRRAASARFIVDAPVGSDAALRDAMDPANQSLADALRLSYRVLQAVILVLIVLFLASGFRTVAEGETGVRTQWGRIVSDEPLAPGLQFSVYPYPIGDFIIFDDRNRTVDLNEWFAPASRGRTRDQMIELAAASPRLTPGIDGSLITREGDLAHLELSAKYIIDQPDQFVRSVNDDNANRDANMLVRLALQRAAVHVTAGLTLQELTELSDDLRQKLKSAAQEALDGLRCGIQIDQVQLHEAYAPLAVDASLDDVTAARAVAEEGIERAKGEAEKLLQSVAGEAHAQLIELIEQYEDALDRDDPQQHEILAKINSIFDGNDVTGEVADIIQHARAYQTQIDQTLGLDYKRFDGLRPSFLANPAVFAKQQWMEAYAQVVNRPDAEVIYVPDPLMAFTMHINGSAEVQEIRRKGELDRRKREADEKNRRKDPYILWGSDYHLNKEGRTLEVKKDGGLVPLGSQR